MGPHCEAHSKVKIRLRVIVEASLVRACRSAPTNPGVRNAMLFIAMEKEEEKKEMVFKAFST